MASGGGAEAHLDSPLWKESRMRGDRGHERESSTRIEMRSEEERLQTFQNWPTDAPVSPAELARTGFRYLGYGDTVQCFCCNGILKHWVHGDTPRGEHERHFPACGLMLGMDVGNVPLGSTDSVDGQLLSQLQRLTMDEQVLSGLAAYPEMESEDSRLSTYHTWPTGASVQPDALAQAGFFYTGASQTTARAQVDLRAKQNNRNEIPHEIAILGDFMWFPLGAEEKLSCFCFVQPQSRADSHAQCE